MPRARVGSRGPPLAVRAFLAAGFAGAAGRIMVGCGGKQPRWQRASATPDGLKTWRRAVEAPGSLRRQDAYCRTVEGTDPADVDGQI